MGMKQELKKLRKSLPPGGRAFVLYEGEQVSPSCPDHPGDLIITLDSQWRPEGASLPEQIEVIPGYVRPENWQEIQAEADSTPGRMVIE